jgi:hypothetical protein
MRESMDKNRIQGASVARAGYLPRSPYPSSTQSVDPESPCRRGPLDLAIENTSIQVPRLDCTGRQDFIVSVAG